MIGAIGGVGEAPLRAVHILLLVSWLGIDVGVFYASAHLRKPDLAPETRVVVMRIMAGLDRGARISLVLLVPVSVGLARAAGLGLGGVSAGSIGAVFWILAVAAWAWVAAFLWSQSAEDSARRLAVWRVVNRAAHVGVMLFFGVTGVLTLTGTHRYWADHVALKSVIFSAIVALGLWIDVMLRDIGPAFAALVDGESEDTLDRFDRAIRRGYVPVLLIYAGLIAVVVISVVRPWAPAGLP